MPAAVLGILAAVFGAILLAILLTVVLVPLFRGIGWVVAHVFAFIGGEIKDSLRLVGACITAAVFSLLVVGNILIFRWSASAHFGRAFSAEVGAGGASIYRILVGHPARLLGLRSLVDGIERRVPEAVAAAPTSDRPSRRTGQFENYRIIGSLAGGGSGGKLYVAEPDDLKLAAFARNGQQGVEQVVIKSFSLRDGSSLPQIVRESRALDAAKRLGLVLDHELTPERFFYVMRYVPGESLGLVTQHLHAASPESGLSNGNLNKALGYAEHLLATLRRYHEGGLWHKDVKPDNIIIHGAEAHLVDFGLITPLRSAMTLTTHGTEYFRDPEMVRMALKGVKVHEVDGARFDVYAAGAVLYSVVENSFPAHGGLSQLTKRCPDALRWIIRRAMTDYDKRYPTASAMLADLSCLRRAPDPFAVKPAELPSVAGAEQAPAEPVEVSREEFSFVPPAGFDGPRRAAPAVVAAAPAASVLAGERSRPRLRVTNWWSGRYALEDGLGGGGADAVVAGVAIGRTAARRSATPRPVARIGGGVRRPAVEQVQSARARAQERRLRARERMATHRHGRSAGRRHASGVNAGVAASIFVFLLFCCALAGAILLSADRRALSVVAGFGEDDAGLAASAPSAPAVPSPGGVAVITPAPPVALPELEGRMLVVSELLPPLDENVQAYLRTCYGALQQAGLELIGIDTGAADPETQDEIEELLTEVRAVRALRPLDSAELRPQLSEWLEKKGVADALLWIAAPTSKGEPPLPYIFGSPEFEEEAGSDWIPSVQRFIVSSR